jgi:RNA polymerase sigma-70 factor (ECF subfamily)
LSSRDPEGAARDAGLVSALIAGDEQAMARIYDNYSSLVYSVALRVCGESGAAEDILQEVFMQLWRNPAAFDSRRGSLPAWLAVITRHRAIDALRKRRPESDLEDVVVSSSTNLANETERNLTVEKIRETLGGMPPAQRTALEMAFFEGLTHSEIAAKTGEPLGTIKTRIRSGLLALREAVST